MESCFSPIQALSMVKGSHFFNLILCDIDISVHLLLFLTPKECIHFSETCKHANYIGTDENVWKFYCHEEWKSKVHCPHAHITEGFKSAYFRSIVLSKSPIVCVDDIPRWVFSFRFKSDAGEHWLSNCPWHLDREATIIRFEKDKNITRYVRKDDATLLQNNLDTDNNLFIPNNSTQYLAAKPTEGVISKGPSDIILSYQHGHDFEENDIVLDPFFPYKKSWYLQWKNKPETLLKTLQKSLYKLSRIGNVIQSSNPMKAFCIFELHLLGILKSNKWPLPQNSLRDAISYCLACGLYGNSIKIHVQDVPVPSYIISRSPTGNWGFVFQSCWAIYTSWHMPLRGKCPLLEDDNLNITVDHQLQEVHIYNSSMIGFD